MKLHVVGIDLGKAVFHLVGMDSTGKVVVRKRCSRRQLLAFTARPISSGGSPTRDPGRCRLAAVGFVSAAVGSAEAGARSTLRTHRPARYGLNDPIANTASVLPGQWNTLDSAIRRLNWS